MTLSLLPSLLLGLGTTTPAVPPPTPAAVTPWAEDVTALLKEYEEAFEAWRTALYAAETEAAQMKIYEAMPAKEFWPRFLELAKDGDPEATLWTLDHATSVPMPVEELTEHVLHGLRLIFFDHHDKPELIVRAGRQVEYLGYVVPAKEIAPILAESFEMGETVESRSATAFFVGQLLARSEDAEDQASGKEWLLRVKEEFGDSEYAVQADDVLFELEHLVVGAIAPSFGGKSVDGEELNLEDYRGQIVVLDFFGFW